MASHAGQIMDAMIAALACAVGQHPGLAILIAFIGAVVEAVAVLGMIIPGTPLLMAVAGAAGLAGMSMTPILVVAVVGAIIGGGVSFWLGGHYGGQIRKLGPFAARPWLIGRAEAFFQRFGAAGVALARFVPVLRSTVPLVAGMAGMPVARFLTAKCPVCPHLGACPRLSRPTDCHGGLASPGRRLANGRRDCGWTRCRHLYRLCPASARSEEDPRSTGNGAMKILIIEDDAQTASYVADGLRELGHAVDVASDGRQGLFMAGEDYYDVVVLDRMLPGMDGIGLVKMIRGAGVSTPVLFLSAHGSVSDRVSGLNVGADDYLVKPFAFSELLARVNALGRRPTTAVVDTVLRVADLEMNLLSRTVARAGMRIDLLPREFQLLEYFMRHAGEVVTRTMLLEAVWELHFDPQTNVVDTHVSRLRAKIERGFAGPLIHTIRRAGYTLHPQGLAPIRFS